jgi:hypothetical protein
MTNYLVTEATHQQLTFPGDDMEVSETGQLSLFRGDTLFATWSPGAWLRAVRIDDAPTKPHIVEETP